MSKPSILLIYTGGTIGMVEDATGVLHPLEFEQLHDVLPEISKLPCEIELHPMGNPIDSSNMTPGYWKEIVKVIQNNYDRIDGFVVMHGSDTMAYTGSALSFMLQGLTKPVILTGSQLPLGIIRSDGRENLITSIELACLQNNGVPVIQEVAIYFEYKLYRANRVQKVDAAHFDAFSSYNYPLLAEAGISLEVNHGALFRSNTSLNIQSGLSNNIATLKFFPGMLPEICQKTLLLNTADIIIMESYGSGNLNTDNWLTEQLQAAIEGGKIVLNITQCNGGAVVHGKYQTSKHLEHLGVVPGGDMTYEAAVTKSMHLLGTLNDKEEIRQKLTQSLAGEITL